MKAGIHSYKIRLKSRDSDDALPNNEGKTA